MLGIVELLEFALKGNWKGLAWFIIGAFCIGLIRVLYGLWSERQTQKDDEFIRAHQEIPIETLQKKMRWLLGSIILLFAIILPATLWLSVEVLKRIESINPGIALAFVFTEFMLILVIILVQTVRYSKLNRRIKRMR